jgi:subtilisin family serine protease
MRLAAILAPVLAAAALAAPAALPSPSGGAAPVPATAVVTYESPAALRTALARYPARLVRRLPDVNSVEVRPEDPAAFARGISAQPGINAVDAPVRRFPASEPALTAMYTPGVPYEWQYTAAHVDAVSDTVLRAAASVTIAVIDTGADLSAPDLAAKAPAAYSVLRNGPNVRDLYGHGTFVASIAGGSVTNGEGLAGFGGDAKLLIVQAGNADGSFTDVDEAEAIVYAVNQGAKVINLSIGGIESSALERDALAYAAINGVLVVAAAGNEYEMGNPVEYPAALVQPVGSNGRGGWGLSVGATTRLGRRAEFSNTGSWISLAAPGEDVFGAISSSTKALDWPRYRLPGSTAGLYGFGSGTSFATPQVAGAAALVWAANPSLTRHQVAWILKRTASHDGAWNKVLGFGVLDVGRAVAMATQGGQVAPPPRADATLMLSVPPKSIAKRSRIRIRGLLQSELPAISPAGRLVTLQALRNGAWRRVARTQTKADGGVVLRARLNRGRYVMRVIYPGDPELAAAVSRTFTLKVPKDVPPRG